MQYAYTESFDYLNLTRNMLISLADVKVSIAALHTGLPCIQVDADKAYNYLTALATYVVSFILIPALDLRQLLSYVKAGKVIHPSSSLQNDPEENI